jgi:CRP-like cAMP-binding protein
MILSEAELSILERFSKNRRTFVAGRDLIHQGQSDQVAYILNSGWACSYKLLQDGQRQIVDFQIPGDFLGLRSILLNTSDHSIEPVTDIEVTEINIADLLDVFASTPRLMIAVLWAVSRDNALVVEHLIDVGRRSASERMAHFLLELGLRLELVGMANQSGYACPLTQYLLADAVGLSAVHVNRVLRKLRDNGMVTFRDGFVRFDDYVSLTEFAQFDPTYLDQAAPRLRPSLLSGKVNLRVANGGAKSTKYSHGAVPGHFELAKRGRLVAAPQGLV